jgi:invasion protein IalB
MSWFGLASALLALGLGAAAAHAQEDPADIVATAIRDNGFSCTNPHDAERDPGVSQPDEQAWTIQCDEGGYRVRFLGDTGAQVEPM